MHSRTYSISPIQTDAAELYDQLNIKPYTMEDKMQLDKIFNEYLLLPSDRLALIHHESNQLGWFDQQNQRYCLKREFINNGTAYQACQCCCSLRQTQLHWCVPVHNIITLGPAQKHFFEDLIMMKILLLVSLLVYSIFAFVTNIIASNNNPIPCAERKMCKLALIGTGSKLFQNKTPQTQYWYVIQSYLGLAMSFVWIIIFISKIIRQKRVQWQQESISPTAANFTIMLQNLPRHFTVQMLQQHLNEYALRVKQFMIYPLRSHYPYDKYDMNFSIVSFNSARAYYETLHIAKQTGPSQAQGQLQQRIKCLRNTIINRSRTGNFIQPWSIRQRLYDSIDQLRQIVVCQRVKNLQHIENLYRQNYLARDTKIVFVTFNHTFAKINLLKLNQTSSFSWLKCFKNKNYQLGIPGLKVSMAPEPQDILWHNIGAPKKQKIFWKVLTFFISAVLLTISFGIMLGLSYVQEQGDNRVLSLLISLVINIVDVILFPVIQYLTKFEKGWTTTSYQSSVGVKIISCQLINSLLLSIIVAKYVKNNIYREGGLVDDVFFFAILNAFIPPLIQFINPYYIYLKYILSTQKTLQKKLKIESQIEYNQCWENPQFQIGLEYAYAIKTVIYTSFFMSLQPIIVLFSLIGLALSYQAKKFTLYYRSKRPLSSSKSINFVMKNTLYLCIISYGLGNLTWSNLLQNSYPKISFIPSVISIGLGVILYILLDTKAIDSLFLNRYAPQNYDDERMFFPSEYDRLNPVTRAKGVRRYLDFVNKKRTQIPINNDLQTDLLQTNRPNDVDAILQISKYIPKPPSNNVLESIKSNVQTLMKNNDPLVSIINIPRKSSVFNIKKGILKAPRKGILNVPRKISTTNRQSVMLPPVSPNERPSHINITSNQLIHSFNSVSPPPQINKNVLNKVIVNNNRQRPSLFSPKYNPLDYIQAVNTPVTQQIPQQ